MTTTKTKHHVSKGVQKHHKQKSVSKMFYKTIEKKIKIKLLYNLHKIQYRFFSNFLIAFWGFSLHGDYKNTIKYFSENNSLNSKRLVVVRTYPTTHITHTPPCRQKL
jgi:hypothetical protein